MEERKMATNTLPANVSVSEATELTKNGARIIDVRTPSEFESVHIPGSYNVPLDQLSEHRRELTQALDSPALLVCGTGIRARQADNTLREAGLDSLTVLEGGITAWEKNGEPVVRGVQKWPLERQVRLVAGSLVLAGALGGLLVWRPLTLISLFVGGGLTFAALTDTCGMAMLLSKLPYNQGANCDVGQVIRQLSVDEGR
jgi:rhodanese-related sulfurtransferase